MMICKFCNSEMGDGFKFCPYCGKTLDEETVLPEETVADVAPEETAEQQPEESAEQVIEAVEEESLEADSCDEEAPADEETLVEEVLSEENQDSEEISEQPKKRKVWVLIAAIAGSVVALGILALVLLMAFGVEWKPFANDIHVKESYCVEDDEAEKAADKVIATIENKELSNVQLQIYYRMQVSDFLQYYGSYASQIGLDLSKPFSEQKCYFEEELTWEQYFLKVALETWQNYQTLVLLAEESGYILSAESEEALSSMPEELETQAKEGEHESADAMLEELFGPGCTLEVYMDYVRTAIVGSEFYNSEYDRLMPNDEDAEAYFDENEDTFAESGITKDGGLTSTVRHILVTPKCTEGEECADAHTEAEWEACYAEAEKILNEWKSGEATEESFAALAGQYTEDTGSASTGGLYENVAPGSNYVESFLNWSIDMNRQPGDTEIVQTEYGYHIMYFVEGKPYWLENAKTQLLSERTTALLDDAKEGWPMKVRYRKIVLQELELQ